MKSKDGFQRQEIRLLWSGFQLRNPTRDFMDFLLQRFIGKFEKGLTKPFL